LARSFIIEAVSTIVGHHLRTARLEAQVTVREAARHISVAPQTLHNWERGRFLPPDAILFSLVTLYGLSLEGLLERLSSEIPMALRRPRR